LNHAGVGLFGDSFAGVDVFLVVSGFLIAGILRDELHECTFSIAGFYERRVRRILPAVFVVSLAFISFACYLMLPGDLRNFGQSLIAVNVSVANVHFLHENG
jgi:peptidoglycan/LPS O-acetylase OafA/YrhL